MSARLRVLAVLVRPPALFLLALFAAVGQVSAAGGEHPAALARALVVVVAYLVFSVAVNDLADVAVDRANLPGDRRRPLASGACSPREMVTVAVISAVVALAGAALLLRWPALPIAAGALALSAAYSMPPVRLAGRGIVAPLVLPAAYVVVPYAMGVLGVRGGRSVLSLRDTVLVAGLYVGFIGRILLKDFRDMRGDALFGKRTFLVRHGRQVTCAVSAACWTVGTLLLVGPFPRPVTAFLFATLLAAALWLLGLLSLDGGSRRDERLVAALAVVGRGTVVVLLAGLSLPGSRLAPLPAVGVMVALTAVVLAQARRMARLGPRPRRIPELEAMSTGNPDLLPPGGPG